MNSRIRATTAVLAVLAGMAIGAHAQAQTPIGTVITYQGELKQSGSPVTVAKDMRFRLYSVETQPSAPGTQVGLQLDRPAVPMTDGKFTVSLDFGSSAWGPDARYLEIDVATGPGTYVTMQPRQRVTVAPVSRYASEAGNAAGAANATLFSGQNSAFYTNAGNMSAGTLPAGRLGGTYSNAMTLNNAGNSFAGNGAGLVGLSASGLASGTVADARLSSNVALRDASNTFTASGNNFAGFMGVGRTTPVTGADAFAVRRTAGPGSFAGMYVDGTDAASLPFYGYATAGSARAWHFLDGGSGTWHLYNNGFRLAVTNTGSVGIGTMAPSARLEITDPSVGPNISHALYGSTGDWYIRSAASTGNVIIQDSGGRVGIGTSSPGAFRLDVQTAGENGARVQTTSGSSSGLQGLTASAGVSPLVSPVGLEGQGGTAVRGVSGVINGNGVVAVADSGFNAWALFAHSTSGFAGMFQGNVQVIGALSKSSGTFLIDHPLDPANKYLSHSFVESPDMMNVYNGNITTDDQGYATITMPEWFQTLNRDFRYQLTVIDEADPNSFVVAKVVRKMSGNEFTIRTSLPNVEVSWQVTGIRQDPWAENNRVVVEREKTGPEKGLYLYPAGYGKPETLGMQHVKDSVEAAPAAPADRPADSAGR